MTDRQGSQSVSLRGTTHARLKAHALSLGTTASPLVQEWLEEYEPFGTKVPKALAGGKAPAQKKAKVEDKPQSKPKPIPKPKVEAKPKPAVQPRPEPKPEPVVQVHPVEPPDPPLRPTQRPPYVTNPPDPNLKPPTPRDPNDGGVISF